MNQDKSKKPSYMIRIYKKARNVLTLTQIGFIYKNSKIRVNCLVLGGVNNKQNSNFLKNYSNKTILNRMSYVGEYNNYLDFMSSDLNTYTTGSCFVVDGGATSIL